MQKDKSAKTRWQKVFEVKDKSAKTRWQKVFELIDKSAKTVRQKSGQPLKSPVKFQESRFQDRFGVTNLIYFKELDVAIKFCVQTLTSLMYLQESNQNFVFSVVFCNW